MRVPTRYALCLVTAAAALVAGWRALPDCACAPVRQSAAASCCCANHVATNGPCGCCQSHSQKPSSPEQTQCACHTALDDQAPVPNPAPSIDQGGSAATASPAFELTQFASSHVRLDALGPPPGAPPDLVISLSRLTC